MTRIIIIILVYSFFGWLLCDIDPQTEYGWLAGIWHGLFFVANLIRKLFWGSLCKAEYCTTAYNVFFWIFSVLSVIGFFFTPVKRVERY